MNIAPLKSLFQKNFSGEGTVFASPGRINIIGEHTDYNKGFVLPAAINKNFYVVIRKNELQQCRIYAADLNQFSQFTLYEPIDDNRLWVKYFYGVIEEMKKSGKMISGIDVLISSEIPLGAGLSSSAALTSAFGFALNELFQLHLSRLDLALIGQKTEHNYIGVKCGLMDQFASLFGKENQLILLDCNDFSYHYSPFVSSEIKIVLFDSQVKHSLASTEYNLRRQDCEEGLQILQSINPKINLLRDFDESILEETSSHFSTQILNRCRFVLQENNRVKTVFESLKNDDIETFGKTIFASHEGLSHQYEVSCSELDFLVEAARQTQGIIGARMMGGGFGGCTINFVYPNDYEQFIKDLKIKFEKKYQKEAKFYEIAIGNGTQKME
ncbi:MAG: galactokinase [Bacteroidales bacterium]|nr:galactokinase [Bacteroidales bacterium]